MTKTPPHLRRQVLCSIAAIALPAVVTNITVPLLSLTDTAIAGHLGSSTFIAAIAIGTSMFNMIYWLFGFLRMGSVGLVAQQHGAGETDQVTATSLRALVIALGAAALILFFQKPLSQIALRFLDPDAESLVLALDYFDICVWGAPATLSTYVLTGCLLGCGDARSPMWVAIGMDLLNILLSIIFAFICRMQLNGLALGTMTAQWTGALLLTYIWFKKHSPHAIHLHMICHPSAMRRLISINTDIMLRTICIIAVTLWFTRIGAQQGTVTLAANALLMQLFTLFSYFMDGLANAGETLCGHTTGAHNSHLLRATVHTLLWVGAAVAALFCSVYFFLGQNILELLTSDTSVVSATHEYFGWAVAVPAMGFMAFTWDGILIGMTRTRLMLWSITVATALFFGCYALLYPSLGNHGLWLAFLTYLAARGAVMAIWGRKLY